MKKLSFEEMVVVEGGASPRWVSVACGGLMAGWGGVLAYGTALAGVTAGASVAVSLVWSGLSIGLCSTLS